MSEQLTLKYRPQTFSGLLGQEPVVRTLSNMLLRGRMFPGLIFGGSRGTGKCVSENTHVFTSQGMLRMRELRYTWQDSDVLSEEGMRPIVDFVVPGESPSRRIVTSKGYSLEGRPEHRIRVWHSGVWEWVRLDSVQVNDVVGLSKGQLVFGRSRQFPVGDTGFEVTPWTRNLSQYAFQYPNLVEEDFAEFMGMLTGDGGVSGNKVYFCSSDRELVDKARRVFYKYFPGLPVKEIPDKRREYLVTISITNKKLASWFRFLGLGRSSYEKTVPLFVRRSDSVVVGAFLRGYFDTDGSCSKIGDVTFSTASYDLFSQIRLLLLNFGIEVSERKKLGLSREGLLLGNGIELFAKWIGFSLSRKAENLARRVATRTASHGYNDKSSFPDAGSLVQSIVADLGPRPRAWHKRFPFLRNVQSGSWSLTRRALSSLVEEEGERVLITPELRSFYEGRLTFDQVAYLNDGTCFAMDLCVGGCPSYVADGFVTHNTTTARILAKSLNCTGKAEGSADPCNQCDNCLEIHNERSFLVEEFDGASHGNIDEVRRIKDAANYVSVGGSYKVWIIDEAQSLTRQAFEAFLKLLEEPPLQVIFVFCSTDTHKFPDTIMSRCMLFTFKRQTVPELVKRLSFICDREAIAFEQEALEIIATEADGGVRDSISVLDQARSYSADGKVTVREVQALLGFVSKSVYLELIEVLITADIKRALALLEEAYASVSDVNAFLSGLVHVYRDLFLVSNDAPPRDLSASYNEQLRVLAQKAAPGYFSRSTEVCLNMMNMVRRGNVSGRCIVDSGLIHLIPSTRKAESAPVTLQQAPKQLEPLTFEDIAKQLDAVPVTLTP